MNPSDVTVDSVVEAHGTFIEKEDVLWDLLSLQ